MKRDLRSVEGQLEQAGALQPDFAFVSAFGLDGTLQAVYPVTPTSLRRNFASRDWYKVSLVNGSPTFQRYIRPPSPLISR